VIRSFALLLVSAAALADAPKSGKQVIVPGNGPAPLSQVIRAGNLIFIAGQLGFPPGTRELVPGGIGPETQAALQNVSANLAKAGLTMEEVVKCTVFLADIEDFQAMNDAYTKFFPKDPPTRTTVAVAALVRKAKVEIECMAAVK
jgi:2-iminobutanoate/2-iminopropanoate deaminase